MMDLMKFRLTTFHSEAIQKNPVSYEYGCYTKHTDLPQG